MDWTSNVGAGNGLVSGRNTYGGGSSSQGDLVMMENDMRMALVGGEGYETRLVVDGSMCMQVMTDEQIELLRKQIVAYAVLCERIVEWHESFSARRQSLPRMRLDNLYCDPLLASGQKITTRQRWTPTSMQLQILENIFDQGTGTPSKQKIREITLALSQYGQISETNVYNWFQNRRARVKRKQAVKLPNNAESVVETEVNSQREKKEGSAKHHTCENTPPRLDGLIHAPEASSDVHSANPETNKEDDDRKSSEGLI